VVLQYHSTPEFRQFLDEKELDKKNIGTFFQDLATKQPESYKRVVSDLTRLGFETATRLGSTVTLADLLPPTFKEAKFKKLDQDLEAIYAKKLPKAKEDDEISMLFGKFSDDVNKELIEVGLKENKTLAKVVKAGARGSPTQYRQTVFAPVAVNDAKGRILTQFPIRQSFAEGLSIPEYLAHTFGARQGAVATKLAVAEAGFFSKQMARAGMTIRVEEHDCGTQNGIPISVDDRESTGYFLARPAGGFNRNNEINSKMLATLKDKGVKQIIVRSPITCEAPAHHHPGAICQLCAGRREKGLPPVGDYIGITASTTLGEPLSQGTLNTKHESGSARKASTASGFKLINQLANVPETFKGKAPLVKHDGEVIEVRKAPQGGYYVDVKDTQGEIEEYYVPEGFEVHVKKGQKVEQGDLVSEGIINPAEVVQLKGIGEGRRYFAETMKRAFEDSGLGGINRRNFELLAKGQIDHVRVTNPKGLGDYLPDQIVHYHALAKSYVARPDAKKVRVDQAYGKYLEIPELHYTIGTRLSSSMIKHLKDHGVEMVTVHDYPPDFEPEMQRLIDVPAYEQDWMHQLYSTNLERRLLQAVNTGASSNLRGPSPVPGLAYGVGFGLNKTSEDDSIEEAEEKFSFE
jgi:DNA-directed RNA polymerase subunit beta'